MVLALKETLERRDPMRRAQRYAERKAQAGGDSSQKPEVQAEQTVSCEQKPVDKPAANAVGTSPPVQFGASIT